MDNTILVVEDDPELQEVLTLNLHNAGYRVLRAGTIRQAEALVNTALPQLVLLDWMLPDTPGLSFARKLRSETRTISSDLKRPALICSCATSRSIILAIEAGGHCMSALVAIRTRPLSASSSSAALYSGTPILERDDFLVWEVREVRWRCDFALASAGIAASRIAAASISIAPRRVGKPNLAIVLYP